MKGERDPASLSHASCSNNARHVNAGNALVLPFAGRQKGRLKETPSNLRLYIHIAQAIEGVQTTPGAEIPVTEQR